MKNYIYTNDIGVDKMICIKDEPDENGKYYFTLWEMLHGEFCGQGKKTKEELEEYLKHYDATNVTESVM